MTRDNVRSVLSNIDLTPKELVKPSIFDSAPLPGGPIKEPPKVINTTLFDLAPMPSNSVKIEQEEKEPKEYAENSEILEATLIFMYNDNYGDGLFGVKDQDLKKILEQKKQECVEANEHFPYGYGRNNDLLKIKGFKRINKGEVVRIQIELRRWENKGRSGFSCYKA